MIIVIFFVILAKKGVMITFNLIYYLINKNIIPLVLVVIPLPLLLPAPGGESFVGGEGRSSAHGRRSWLWTLGCAALHVLWRKNVGFTAFTISNSGFWRKDGNIIESSNTWDILRKLYEIHWVFSPKPSKTIQNHDSTNAYRCSMVWFNGRLCRTRWFGAYRWPNTWFFL